MNVLYFDCNGVLIKDKGTKLDVACVARLASLAKNIGAELVCCDRDKSSATTLKEVTKAFSSRGIHNVKCVSDLSAYIDEGVKAQEILQYNEVNNVKKYVVVTSSPVDGCDTFIVDSATGISDKDVKKLKRLFVA